MCFSFVDTCATQSAAAAAQEAGRVALIDYRLGVIALAVEENSAAQKALDKCAVSQVSQHALQAEAPVML